MGPTSGIASYVVNNRGRPSKTRETSAQTVALVAVIAGCQRLQDVPCSLYTDSEYTVSILRGLETATPTDRDPSTVITALLS